MEAGPRIRLIPGPIRLIPGPIRLIPGAVQPRPAPVLRGPPSAPALVPCGRRGALAGRAACYRASAPVGPRRSGRGPALAALGDAR